MKSNERAKRCSLDELFSSANDFSNELFAATSNGRENFNSVEPDKPEVERSSLVLLFENYTDANSFHQVECRLSVTTSLSLNKARPDPSEELCTDMRQVIV